MDNSIITAIKKYYEDHDCTIFYSPAVYKPILTYVKCCNNSIPLKLSKDGLIDIHDLEEWLDVCINKPFVVINYLNNDPDTIQKIKRITGITHSNHGVVYFDCIGNKSTISNGDII